MAAALGHSCCGHHVEGELDEGDARIPGEGGRHAGPARRLHPVGLSPPHVRLEEGDGIGGILQIGDLHRPPAGCGEFAAVARVEEAEHRGSSRLRQPGRRPLLPRRRHLVPGAAGKGWAGPQRTLEGIAQQRIGIGRKIGIEGTEAESEHEKPWPLVTRQRAPMAVDSVEHRFRRLLAIDRIDEQREPARQIGVLHRHGRDVPNRQNFQRKHRGRIDPARSRRRGDDEELSAEGVGALQFGKCEVGALLRRLRRIEAHIDLQRVLGIAPGDGGDLRGGG